MVTVHCTMYTESFFEDIVLYNTCILVAVGCNAKCIPLIFAGYDII